MTQGVLIIEDESLFAQNVGAFLHRHGYRIQIADTGEGGLQAVEKFRPDLVLLDYRLGERDGLELLPAIRRVDDSAKTVLMTGHGSIDIAVRAMKAGACDFLTKPVPLDRIKRLVERIVGGAARPTAQVRATPALEGHAGLIGNSAAMVELKTRVAQITGAGDALASDTPPSVLVTGETGTGKELIARALHGGSPRRNGPFISVNCAAIPSHLVEAELFGFERGAFTDAKAAKPGLIESAQGGVLFLDEVGDLDLSVQSKLLRVLEERTVRRVGSVTEKRLDLWVVSATNRPLERLVAERAFRSDLLYRLKVLCVEAPRLQDRGDDVLLLADHFLADMKTKWRRPALRFTLGARRRFVQHHWPGNVRELRNIIEQAVLLSVGDAIDANQILLDTAVSERSPIEPLHSLELPQLGIDLKLVERNLLYQALERTGGNVSAAAALLSLSRDTMRYRIEKYGLHRPHQ